MKWDGVNAVDVILPTQYKDKVCGMCGNYNEKSEDDWTVGPACPNYEGQIVSGH